MGFSGGSVAKNLPAMQKTQERWVQSLGQEDPLEEKNGNPLQYSCLEESHGQRSLAPTIHRAAKSQIRLRDLAQYFQ